MVKMSGILEINPLNISIIAVVVSFCALRISSCKELILPYIIKPKIEVSYGNSYECIHGIYTWENNEPQEIGFSLRLRIQNNGNSTAKGCYVKLISVRDSEGKKIEQFDPAPLKWVIFDTDKIDLAKKEHHLVKLVSQSLNTDFFIPSTLDIPNDLLWNLKKHGAGRYRLDITIYGDNIEPVSKQIGIIVEHDYIKLRFGG